MIRKTALVTALSVAGVVLAGGAAIGASVGILNSADTNQLGQLTPADLVTTEATAPATTQATIPADVEVQTFDVDAAGSVEIFNADGVLSLGTITAVDGWTATTDEAVDGSINVGFTDGTQQLEFVATPTADGGFDVTLDRVGDTSTSTTTSHAYDDDHEDHEGDDDHDEYEDDDHDDDHDESEDDDDHDDDHDEYEGADDDD